MYGTTKSIYVNGSLLFIYQDSYLRVFDSISNGFIEDGLIENVSAYLMGYNTLYTYEQDQLNIYNIFFEE